MIPLQQMPMIDQPFITVAVDLVKPIHPVSNCSKRYILTDYAMRYYEDVALSKIDTETVADVLIEMYSRIGFPEEY